MEKTLKYCIKGTDTFIPFAESPAGTYYLNIDKKLVIFISSNDMSNEDAYIVDGLMATISVVSGVEIAREIKRIHNTFIRLDVDKDWDPDTPVTYKISGELTLTVSGKAGNLYVDAENKRWYFEPSIKELRNTLLGILKASFRRDVKTLPKVESSICVIETWKEIEEDAIISN